MSRAIQYFFKLTVERLEDREVPVGNLPWPIAGNPEILSTYGQFIEGGGLHFHEGLDILAAVGAPVSSISTCLAGSGWLRFGVLPVA